jgi:hypothetical protein
VSREHLDNQLKEDDMYLDERNVVADAVALSTAAPASTLLGDQIPLGVARDIGNGEQLYMVIQVSTAVTSGGAATVKFTVASDATAVIATDGSATEHGSTIAIPVASLTAGATWVIPLPMEGNAYEEFLGVWYTVGTAALTAGAVNAFLTTDVAKWTAQADAL